MWDVINNLHNTIKIALSLLVFGIWPLSSLLVFLYEPTFFQDIDILKLSLLIFGVISPSIFLNTVLLLWIIKPSNPALANRYRHDNPVGASLMLAVAIVMLIIIAGLPLRFFDTSLAALIKTLTVGEILVVAVLGITIYKES